MTLTEAIKKLDRDSLVAILLTIVKEFPIIREQVTTVLKEHFKNPTNL